MEQKRKILSLLSSQQYAVIATVTSKSMPESAFIGFAECSDLTIVFGTNITTRKFKNIEESKHVALTVTDSQRRITVQYEGISLVLEAEEKEKYLQVYFQKLPSARKYQNDANTVYLKVIPTWIRYSDLNAEPDEIFEVMLS